MFRRRLFALSVALAVSPAVAQDQNAQVWAVFAYTLHGDSIPQALSRPNSLTPYGANQLLSAGSAFRDRYVAVHSNSSSPSTRIGNLSPYLLENEDMDVISTANAAVVASAQAFMQGLYPPLDQLFNETSATATLDLKLANGSTASPPLGGYQYPQIITLGLEDPSSITLAGQELCPMHAYANMEYVASSAFWQTYQESAPFYAQLYSQALSGEFDSSGATYANATTISEYLDYQAVHNESLLHNLNPEDVARARWYAGQYVFATNGNTSSSDSGLSGGDIRTIAGQGLATNILSAFETNIQAQGANSKMNLLFGNSAPAVALASVMQLADAQNANFYSLPLLGASMVFELFSLESEDYPTYPDPSQLYVRFLLRNGTDAEFRTYPLFGHSPSSTAIPYSEFQSEVQNIALASTQEWCLKCNSSAIFCSGVLDTDDSKDSKKGSGGLSPVVAGVIGAVVTIVVLALAALIGFLVYSMRTKRHKPSNGGFKGDRKMASDEDVSFKNLQWGDDIKRTDAPDSQNIARGHERHGSWEMRGQKSSNSPVHPDEQDIGSSFADEIEEEWRIHSLMEPVKVHEHV